MDDGVVEWEGEVPQGESINLMTKLTAASAVRQREANEAVGLSEQESTGGTVEQGGAGAGQCCGAGLPLWAAWVVAPASCCLPCHPSHVDHSLLHTLHGIL